MAVVLRAVKGATFQEPLTVLNRDGTPTNLTGAALTWMAKRRIDDADVDAVLTATSAGGTIDIVAAATGQIRFDIPAATMNGAAIEPGRVYAWTLQVYVGGLTTRYPDAFQGAPGKLIVAPSAIVAVPS